MQARRVEVWVWVLVYGGMALLGLGLAVQRSEAPLGWWIVAVGSTLAVIGVVLIWVRSRMNDES